MELWVRSQDRETLIQTKLVEIDYYGELSFTSIYARLDGRNVHLGSYRTRERALEILDEIQNKLMPYSEVSYNEEDTIINFKNMSIIVYEMPEK